MEITEYKNSVGEDMILLTYEDRTESMYKWQYEERLAVEAQREQSGTL